MGRWELECGRYEPGAWLHGRLFPRRSDLSPDGRLLCYFAHKTNAEWEHGETYVAISRLPWLSALHARVGTANTRRCRSPTACARRPRCSSPRSGGAAGKRPRTHPRGTRRTPGERRNARMQKRQPSGERLLCVESLGWAGGEFGTDQAVDGLRVRYWLEAGDDLRRLDDVQWADWDREGRLLVATRRGGLQIRRLEGEHEAVVSEEDLSRLEPDPRPAPPWARTW